MQEALKHYGLVLEIYCLSVGNHTKDARAFVAWAEKCELSKHLAEQASLNLG